MLNSGHREFILTLYKVFTVSIKTETYYIKTAFCKITLKFLLSIYPYIYIWYTFKTVSLSMLFNANWKAGGTHKNCLHCLPLT